MNHYLENVEKALGENQMGGLLWNLCKKTEVLIKAAEAAEHREDFQPSAIDIAQTYGAAIGEMIADVNVYRTMAVAALHEAMEEPEAAEVDDGQTILDLLLPAVQATRAGEDVTDLRLTDDPKGFVEVEYRDGSTRHINIADDSGIAMIRDVCKGIM